MGLLSAIGVTDSLLVPFINTGTMYDLITGAFVPGIDGHFILNGGLAVTNGAMAKPQQYKSTLMSGLIVNAMARFSDSEALIFDAESSLNKRRMVQAINLHYDEPEKREALLQNIQDRIVINTPLDDDLESFMDKARKLAAKKQELHKDLERETPLIDLRTGKQQRMLAPTFVFVDSWTFSKVRSAVDMLEKHAASSADTNRVFMVEGLTKKKLFGMIPALCSRTGIYFLTTAHVGNKGPDMTGGYGPPPKDMQYMKQGEKAKGVGDDFMFLLSNLFELRSAKVEVDQDKECLYPFPSGITAPTEISTVISITTRCKNNNSGTKFEPVMSQTRGIDTNLTNYHYLRQSDYFGLQGNKTNHQPILYPDAKLMRKNATSKLLDYKTSRAIELLAQLCYIQNNWSISDSNRLIFAMTPTEFTDALVKRSGYAMDDILNSRGWWTYDDHPRPYLSLLDILNIASGEYKPKLHAVTIPT